MHNLLLLHSAFHPSWMGGYTCFLPEFSFFLTSLWGLSPLWLSFRDILNALLFQSYMCLLWRFAVFYAVICLFMHISLFLLMTIIPVIFASISIPPKKSFIVGKMYSTRSMSAAYAWFRLLSISNNPDILLPLRILHLCHLHIKSCLCIPQLNLVTALLCMKRL